MTIKSCKRNLIITKLDKKWRTSFSRSQIDLKIPVSEKTPAGLHSLIKSKNIYIRQKIKPNMHKNGEIFVQKLTVL